MGTGEEEEISGQRWEEGEGARLHGSGDEDESLCSAMEGSLDTHWMGRVGV